MSPITEQIKVKDGLQLIWNKVVTLEYSIKADRLIAKHGLQDRVIESERDRSLRMLAELKNEVEKLQRLLSNN